MTTAFRIHALPEAALARVRESSADVSGTPIARLLADPEVVQVHSRNVA